MIFQKKLTHAGMAIAASAACVAGLFAVPQVGVGEEPPVAAGCKRAVSTSPPANPAAKPEEEVGIEDETLTYNMLRNPRVRDELKMDDDQKKRIDEVFASAQKDLADAMQRAGAQPSDKDLQAIFKRVSGVQGKASREILKPEQAKRLDQISLQVRGPQAYTTPRVVKALKLTEDQQKKAVAVNEGFKKAMDAWAQAGMENGIPSTGTAAEREQIEQKARTSFNDLLTKDQRAAWKEMVGTDVSLEKLMELPAQPVVIPGGQRVNPPQLRPVLPPGAKPPEVRE